MRELSLAVAAVLAVACGARELSPEPLRVDRVHCAICGMLISRERDAAQAVFPDADARFYDDIGCLARDRGLGAGARLYVQADGGSGWLDVEKASFARPAGHDTPMGYGFAALRDSARARETDREGRALRWGDVRAEAEARR
jgi:nitrous oxide reductase accessory protein NosL